VEEVPIVQNTQDEKAEHGDLTDHIVVQANLSKDPKPAVEDPGHPENI